MTRLHLLSGGAAKGLVAKLAPRFAATHGGEIDGHYGAVGAMRQRLLDGAPCDVLILTQALIDELTAQGRAVAGSARPLGTVRTGIAVKNGDEHPRVDTPEALADALRAARGIYFPDPQQATAGIHFMRVLERLGLVDVLRDRLRPHPNGATAMRAMAQAEGRGDIGCTQITEILDTPGVQWVQALPPELGLTTVYTAAVARDAARPREAEQLIALLADASSASVRQACGFE